MPEKKHTQKVLLIPMFLLAIYLGYCIGSLYGTDHTFKTAADQLRSIALHPFPLQLTPMTGKYHMECAEVNGPVSLCGCLVMPGDLIVADGSGVCIVPNELVEEVLEKAEKSAAKEEEFSRILEAGGGIGELKKAK